MQVNLTTSDDNLTGTAQDYEIKILSKIVELDEIKSYRFVKDGSLVVTDDGHWNPLQ